MSMLKNIKNIKKVARLFLDICLLTYGIILYRLNKNKPLNERTDNRAYLSMIRLFCVTAGISNDIASKCISVFDKKIKLPNANGVLGNLTAQQIKSITKNLESEGYHIFDQMLPPEVIDRLYQFALNQECSPRLLDEQDIHQAQNIKAVYDKNHLLSSVYDIAHACSTANNDVQSLLTDYSILSIAQAYLKTSPKAEPVAFWWSTPFSKKAQANSAQNYHFDMDRFKWIKFFIFLTDVTLCNGPHVFVSQSHRTFGIPAALLKAGYTRLSDEEVQKYYPQDNIKTFTVKAGTIVAEDTRGLHKGTPLVEGERLVLELQFSNSLFGAISPAIKQVAIDNAHFKEISRKFPKVYQLYSVYTQTSLNLGEAPNERSPRSVQ